MGAQDDKISPDFCGNAHDLSGRIPPCYRGVHGKSPLLQDFLMLAQVQCCFLFENHSTGITTCKGHPAIYFEKMRKDRAKQKGDRLASVKIPWVGEVAGFEYEEDEENPKAKFRIMGKECELEGAPAKFFKSMVEGYGFKL